MNLLGIFAAARLALQAACGLLFATLMSCQHTDVPVFYLSFHQVPSQQELVDRNMFVVINSADGERQEIIARYPLFDSARIVKAEKTKVAEAGKYGLTLYLDRQGLPAWHELTVYQRTTPIAVIMDGFYLGIATFTSNQEEVGVLTTNQLWTEYEADKIIEHVEANYRRAGKK